MFKISYIKPLIAILLVRTAAHFPYPDFIVPAFPISDSWLEEFAIRLHDPVQFLVLCLSWHDCLLLWQSALFTKQQRQCWTRLSSIIISVTICYCQRKIQMDKRFSQGKWKSTVKAREKNVFISLRLFEIKINYFSFISVVCVRGSTLPLPPGEVCWQLGFHFLYDVTFTHF